MFEEVLLRKDLNPIENSAGDNVGHRPVFISPTIGADGQPFGTRASTVVLCDCGGIVHVSERCFDEDPPPLGVEV